MVFLMYLLLLFYIIENKEIINYLDYKNYFILILYSLLDKSFYFVILIR